MSIVNLLTKIRQVKKTEGLRPDEIQRLNSKRFRSLLKHVLTNSNFYKEYYGRHGVMLENYNEVSLADLPPIDKQLMMENYDDFVCDQSLKKDKLEKFISDPANRGKKFHDQYKVIHTSGSTGRLGIFAYNQNDWNILKALVLTRISKAGINPFNKTKICFIGATDGQFAGISLSSDAPKFIFDFLSISANSPLAEITEKINAFQPDIISGYSSGSYLLAQQQKKGTINVKPRRIICSGDPLT